jgi:hypothetical protein
MVFSQYHTCTICVVDNEHGDDFSYSSHCISVLCYFFVWCFCLSSANIFLLHSPHVWSGISVTLLSVHSVVPMSLTLILSMKSLILYEDEYTLFLKHSTFFETFVKHYQWARLAPALSCGFLFSSVCYSEEIEMTIDSHLTLWQGTELPTKNLLFHHYFTVLPYSDSVCFVWLICRSLCRPLYVFGYDACFYRDKLKLNEAYPDKFVADSMRIWLTFLISIASWLLGNIMTESSHCFCKCNRNSGRRFCIAGCWDFSKLLFTYPQPLSGADEVMAACHY